ncbi:MAG: glycine--tRNA ligase [Verrucomicrobia bacterium]|nr:glycine--tRNA ligase [Verrucomicrobiota bacterium]MDA1006579.1 glycine--tRNA ligase [Verrucomicrobiota bacterium]
MANKEQTDTARMEKIVSLCKRKGFIFQSAELYGGLNGCWDYGPLGTELKRNLKDYWWRRNVQERDDILGLDGSILTHQAVLTASGHIGGFSDPMVDCKTCKGRFRADSLDSMECKLKPSCIPGAHDKCELTEPRDFELMFKTQMGASADENDPNATAYLRPETAQSIFVQYKNVMDSNRVKLPFGIAQIGKSFRNEINPRNFTFRSREFEQMEIEYFCRPEDGLRLTDEWLAKRLEFYAEIGLDAEKLHVLDIPDGERAHYSQKTYDIEYDFPFGQQELEGVAYRGDYDLGKHQGHSGKPLEYFDEQTKEKLLPHVVEPSAGCDRTVLALICEAYDEEDLSKDDGKPDIRTVMRFDPKMAPIKAAILPLLKNKPELVAKAKEVQALLQPWMNIFYDETAAIGRRYRRQDEVGTPFCIAIDFETIGEGEGDDKSLTDTVTIRHRDSMEQERLPIADLLPWLAQRIR